MASTNPFNTSNPFRSGSNSDDSLVTIDQIDPSYLHSTPISPYNPFGSQSSPYPSASYDMSRQDSSTPARFPEGIRRHTLFPRLTPAADSGLTPPTPTPAAPLINSHMDASATLRYKAPAPTRPTASHDISAHAWRKFLADWAIFKRIANIPPANYSVELYMCCSEQLQSAIYSSCPSFTEISESELLNIIDQLVMKPKNRAATRKKFQSLAQQPGEGIVDYMTRILQAAADCAYSCPNCKTDMTDEHARDQLMIGLANSTLQKEVMCKEDTLPTMADVVHYCAAFESATTDQRYIRDATHETGVNLATSKLPSPPLKSSSAANPSTTNANTAKSYPSKAFCNGCGCKPPHVDREKQCPAWGKKCLNCGVLNHFKSVCRSAKRPQVAHISWDPTQSAFVPSPPERPPTIPTEI